MADPLDADDQFYRRVMPSQIIDDEKLGRRRPSSAAFSKRDHEDHASCYIHSLLDSNGLTPDDVLDGHDQFGLIAGTVECLRSYDCDAAPDPIVSPTQSHRCDPAHGKLIEPPDRSPSAIRKNWGKFARDPALQVLADPDALPAPPPPAPAAPPAWWQRWLGLVTAHPLIATIAGVLTILVAVVAWLGLNGSLP